jgi:hypothetical protein
MKWRVVLYCVLGGLPLTLSALGASHFPWWWVSGILAAVLAIPGRLLKLSRPREPTVPHSSISPCFCL